MLVVAALGGNALQQRGQPLEADVALDSAKVAAAPLAEIAREHQLVVTHGNGPQIGLLASQSEAFRDVRSYPLDLLGAETEGMIGYLLERELADALPDRQIASLLTQTVVDARDPAFARPTKPIGPIYRRSEAQRLSTERGWNVAADTAGWRRVVASPVPRSIIEQSTIKLLVEHDVLVVCAGGGGVPVVLDRDGARYGVEAVVDKDAASALLARSLGADLLLLLTDVAAVQRDWGTDTARPIGAITAEELHELSFAPDSMGPKTAAAAAFVTTTGGRAAIGALGNAVALVAGDAGTQVRAEGVSEVGDAEVRCAP